jgi:hypothetical protein
MLLLRMQVALESHQPGRHSTVSGAHDQVETMRNSNFMHAKEGSTPPAVHVVPFCQ